MKYEFAFMGCGNMGGALVRAVAKAVSPTKIALFDKDTEKANALGVETGAIPTTLKDVCENARFLVLGVKPQVMDAALLEAQEYLLAREDLTLITMAAGLSISAVKQAAGKRFPTIRIMPNTPAEVGEGMILYCADHVDGESLQAFLTAFAPCGKLMHMEESKIDAASALSGCGPAFCDMFIEALADGAVECGIPRAQALELAAQTALGASKMVLKHGNPGTLKDNVCSPGGTTIAGVHALEKDGLRAAAMDAVLASYQKTLALKK